MGRAYQNRKESMAKTAGQKTRIYSRYGKEIYVCAKNGGFDPDGNSDGTGVSRADFANYPLARVIRIGCKLNF